MTLGEQPSPPFCLFNVKQTFFLRFFLSPILGRKSICGAPCSLLSACDYPFVAQHNPELSQDGDENWAFHTHSDNLPRSTLFVVRIRWDKRWNVFQSTWQVGESWRNFERRIISFNPPAICGSSWSSIQRWNLQIYIRFRLKIDAESQQRRTKVSREKLLPI